MIALICYPLLLLKQQYFRCFGGNWGAWKEATEASESRRNIWNERSKPLDKISSNSWSWLGWNSGNVRIRCPENGLEAELGYGAKSFFGLRGSHRSVKGKIYEKSTRKTLFELNGHWDRYLTSN